MNKFSKRLLEGEILTPDQITPEEALETFYELRMLMILQLKGRELMNIGVLKFMLGPRAFGIKDEVVDVLKYGLHRTNLLTELSYSEVQDKLEELIETLKVDIDKINMDTIYAYNNLAHRNNAIVQSLLDLSGEFHAYYEGNPVEKVKTL